MGKYYGKVGFAVPTEPSSGVIVEKIFGREYFGDVIKFGRRLQTGGSLNDNLVITNTISVYADPYITDNIEAIRCAEYMGKMWKVDSIDVDYPRITLTLGGIYNGTPST